MVKLNKFTATILMIFLTAVIIGSIIGLSSLYRIDNLSMNWIYTFGLCLIEYIALCFIIMLAKNFVQVRNDSYTLKYGNICTAYYLGCEERISNSDIGYYAGSYSARTGNRNMHKQTVKYNVYKFSLTENGVIYEDIKRPCKIFKDKKIIIRYSDLGACVDNKTAKKFKGLEIAPEDSELEKYQTSSKKDSIKEIKINENKMFKRGLVIISIILLLQIIITHTTLRIMHNNKYAKKETNTVKVNEWDSSVKAKMQDILGEVLPEYEFTTSSCYFSVYNQRQANYNNSYYLLDSKKEATIKFSNSYISYDTFKLYFTSLTKQGYSFEHDYEDVDSWNSSSKSGVKNDISFIRMTNGKKLIQLTINTNLYDQYYEYYGTMAIAQKGIWMTIAELN